jgi:uncharacterized membrane protein
MKMENRIVAVVLVTFLVLFIPSLRAIHTTPYHFDEAYSIYIARMPWVEMESLLLDGADTHPPLYNNLLKLWMSFSTSYIWIRLSSVLLALASIIAVYYIGRENFNEEVGLLSAGIISTSGFFISLSGLVCLYSLFLFFSSLSVYFFLRLIKKQDTTTVLYYTLATTIGMYTHWFFAYVILSEVLFLLWDKKDVKMLVNVYLPVGLLCIPLLPFISSQIEVLKYASANILNVWVTKVGVSTLVDFYASISTTEVSGFIFLFILIVGLVFKPTEKPKLKKGGGGIRKGVVFFAVLMAVPVLMTALADMTLGWNSFVDRHFVFFLIPIPILLSYFAVNSGNKTITTLLLLAIALNFYHIADGTYSTFQGGATDKDEIATYSRYDFILHMSAFSFFPSTVYDWDNRYKHLLVYDSRLERNPLLDYALKSGVINESNILQSCDELRGKKVAVKDSNSWVAIKSITALSQACYPKNSAYFKELPTLIYPVAKTTVVNF